MRNQYLILPETVLGLDRRGQFVRYEDFQKNYEVLKTIVKLNSRGKQIAKKASFYRINREVKRNEK